MFMIAGWIMIDSWCFLGEKGEVCTICQIIFGPPVPAGKPGEPGEDGMSGKNHNNIPIIYPIILYFHNWLIFQVLVSSTESIKF